MKRVEKVFVTWECLSTKDVNVTLSEGLLTVWRGQLCSNGGRARHARETTVLIQKLGRGKEHSAVLITHSTHTPEPHVSHQRAPMFERHVRKSGSSLIF